MKTPILLALALLAEGVSAYPPSVRLWPTALDVKRGETSAAIRIVMQHHLEMPGVSDAMLARIRFDMTRLELQSLATAISDATCEWNGVEIVATFSPVGGPTILNSPNTVCVFRLRARSGSPYGSTGLQAEGWRYELDFESPVEAWGATLKVITARVGPCPIPLLCPP